MSIERLNEFWPEWKIEKELGEGSYGKVYSAVREDHSLKSYAAIKVITIPHSKAEISSLRSEGLSEEETRTFFDTIVTDFVNEIKLMETLKGVTNIVSVEDYRILEAKVGIGWDIFIRMELLTPFSEYAQRHPMSEADVLDMAIDICTGLEVCFKNNIIHRDIKPANIFVSKLGDYKLGDFGVAKELEKTTGAMSTKGTYSYMAPEVTMGRRYDATVDIYSLGLVMYGLLNNNRGPFLDPNKSMLSYNDRVAANDKRMAGEPLPPPCNASELTANVILTACSFDPKKRFSNPTAFKNILTNCKNSLGTAAPVTVTKSSEAASYTDSDATVSIISARKPQTAAQPVQPIQPAEADEDATIALIKNPVQPQNENNAPEAHKSENKKEPEIKKEPPKAPEVHKEPEKKKKKGNGKRIVIGIVIWLVIAAIAVAVAFFLLNNNGSSDKNSSGNKSEDKTETTEAASPSSEDDDSKHSQPALNVGDIITLGEYEQDNDLSNGAEPVEWIVIDQQDGCSLLLSKYALDAAPFVDPENYEDIYGKIDDIIISSLGIIDTDNDSIIINGTTVNEEELLTLFAIPENRYRSISIPKYSGDNSNSWSTGFNRFFLLNIEEAESLLTGEQRKCEATEYAKANGAYVDSYCWWWLEDEIAKDSIANINAEGEIVTEPGLNITNRSGCIRPAMWINISEFEALQ